MDNEQKQEEGFDLMVKLTAELEKESDRGMALLAASYLEFLLGSLVITKMLVEPSEAQKMLLEGPNAPLATFSSRIDMAYCLGLLNHDQKRDLNLIRKIRNVFAHEFMRVSFDTPQIASRCNELKSAQVDGQPSTAMACYRKASVRLMAYILLRMNKESA